MVRRTGHAPTLADARDWIQTLGELANAMEQLDPPGWRETLGSVQRLHAAEGYQRAYSEPGEAVS